MTPSLRRDPFDDQRHVFPPTSTPVLSIGIFIFLQLVVLFLKSIRGALQEHQPEDHMLVLSGVHMPAKLVGSGPKLFFKSEIGTVGLIR